MNMIQ